MNNFKKLLASAMALSMVASVLPTNQVSADSLVTVCQEYSEDVALMRTNLNKLLNLITDEDTERDYTNVQLDDEIIWEGSEKTVEEVLNLTFTTESVDAASYEVPVKFNTLEELKAYVTANQDKSIGWKENTVDVDKDTEFTDGTDKMLGSDVVTKDWYKNDQFNTESFNYYKFETVTISNEWTFAEGLAKYADCLSESAAAKHLGGLVDGVNGLEKLIKENNLKFYSEEENSDEFPEDVHSVGTGDYLDKNDDLDSTKITAMKNDYYELIENAYVGNLSSDYASIYETTIQMYEDAFDAFGTNVEIEGLERYIDALEKAILDLADKTGATDARLDEVVDNVDATNSNLKAWEDLLEDVQKNKLTGDNLPRYADVEEAEEVVELVGIIEDSITRIEDVLDFVKKSNEAVKEFTTRQSNGAGKKTIAYKQVETVLAEMSKDDPELEIADLTTVEIDRLVNYVEEVVEHIVTPEVRRTGSTAQYYLRLTPSEYYGNLTTNQINKYLGYVGIEGDLDGIFAVDREDGTTVYDSFVAYRDKVLADVDTLENGLDGVTVNNLNSANASKVLNAKAASSRVAKYTLTDEQEDAVEEANMVIDVLYTKMLVDGIVANQTGWVDLGNGNWDYYDENGTAFTGWVCSAKDVWYYVSNGHMLRNAWIWRDATSAYYVGNDGVMLYGPATTPDGYAIDANGLWHA